MLDNHLGHETSWQTSRRGPFCGQFVSYESGCSKVEAIFLQVQVAEEVRALQ